MISDEQRSQLLQLLKNGEELSPEWARVLFPPEKREYELTYYGKEREEDILADTLAVPLQPVRSFGNSDGNGVAWQNMLIFGDNLQVLKSLLELKTSGKLRNQDGSDGVRLIYIDPPFATKQDFRANDDQKAYQDKIAGATFIEFLRRRLIFLRELLAPNGSIYIHLDYRKLHYIKAILDEVLGESNFINEIIWQRTASHNDPGRYGCVHDTLLLYKRGSEYIWNAPKMEQSPEYIEKFFVYAESPDKKQWIKLKKGEEPPERWERYRLGNFASPHPRENLTYPYKGYSPPKNGWKVNIARMKEMDAQRLLHYPRTKSGRIQPKQYLKDTVDNKAVPDVWLGISPIQSQSAEKQNYPTQKPEALLERIVSASSNPGDIVLDCFAGSGTTPAVAEKLGRKWIAIDCGKLAIYTIQKRMLNLHTKIGEKGSRKQPTPFALSNAGLYDFSKLRQLEWKSWRFFALQLFQCRDEPHTIGGIKLDGYFKGASVLVFNHTKEKGVRIDEATIESIHEALGTKVGRKLFIIAPALTFDFQQDYIDLGDVRYFALRIPYSIIHELHKREFTALKQPADEIAVNDTVEAVGFDFIRIPELKFSTGTYTSGKNDGLAYIKITTFKSEAILRDSSREYGNLDTLSMVMLDYDFDDKQQIFELDAVFYAENIKTNNWSITFSPDLVVGEAIMAVFIDIYGNEARVRIPAAEFGISTKPAKKRATPVKKKVTVPKPKRQQ